MALDVLSERGYTTVLDLKKQRVPISVDLKTGAVKTKTKRLYEFAIEFPKPKIRRG